MGVVKYHRQPAFLYCNAFAAQTRKDLIQPQSDSQIPGRAPEIGARAVICDDRSLNPATRCRASNGMRSHLHTAVESTLGKEQESDLQHRTNDTMYSAAREEPPLEIYSSRDVTQTEC
jgi:hypothetical protein